MGNICLKMFIVSIDCCTALLKSKVLNYIWHPVARFILFICSHLFYDSGRFLQLIFKKNARCSWESLVSARQRHSPYCLDINKHLEDYVSWLVNLQGRLHCLASMIKWFKPVRFVWITRRQNCLNVTLGTASYTQGRPVHTSRCILQNALAAVYW